MDGVVVDVLVDVVLVVDVAGAATVVGASVVAGDAAGDVSCVAVEPASLGSSDAHAPSEQRQRSE